MGRPVGKEALRDALREVSGQVCPGDVVLVYYFGDAVARWYRSELDLGPKVHPVPLCRPGHLDKQHQLHAKLAGAKRVFYVAGMLNATTRRDNFAASLRELETMGLVVEKHDDTRDRRGPRSWAPVELDRRPREPCLELY